MKLAVLFLALTAFMFPANAQSEQDVRVLAREVIDDMIRVEIDRFAGDPCDEGYRADIIDKSISLLAGMAADPIVRRKLVDEWRFRRADIQTGAGPSNGTTSSVLNPLFPAIFGISMEYGSITRTVTGSTVSIKINPAGFFYATAVPDTEASHRVNCFHDMFQRLGTSVSFDMNRGDVLEDTTGVKPLSDQFSGLAIRMNIKNSRDPKNSAFQKRMSEWRKKAEDYVNELNELAVDQDSLKNEVENVICKAAKLPSKESRAAAVRSYMTNLLTIAYFALEEVDINEFKRLADKWWVSEKASRNLYYQYAHGLVVSAEYAYQRPDVTTEMTGTVVPVSIRPPSLHTVRLLVAKGFADRLLDFNFNLSASWFGEKRLGMGSYWRDIRAGAESKFLLKKIPNYGVPVLSFSGVWMYLREPPLGLGVTIQGENINKTGHIGVFQTKLELPTAKAAVRIPISFTWSNRTELIQESDVRGQIGITVNLDAFFESPSQ